jgi:hypothetical protein
MELCIGIIRTQEGINTTQPVGKTFFGVMEVYAEFDRSMIHERELRPELGGAELDGPHNCAWCSPHIGWGNV